MRPAATRWTRWLALTVGAGLSGYGGYLLLAGGWPAQRSALTWFVGGVVLHDALLVPLTLLVGVLLLRVVPGTYRGLVQGALVVSAVLALALLPLMSGRGRTPSNLSQQPLPYTRNLLLVLIGVWLVTAALALWRARPRLAASADTT